MHLKYTAALESIPTHKFIISSNQQFKYKNLKCSEIFCKRYDIFAEKISRFLQVEKLSKNLNGRGE